jgi:hypothetical protein
MRLIIAILIIAGMMWPNDSIGWNNSDVLEKSGKGIINWSQGTIQATCEPLRSVNNGAIQKYRPFSAKGDIYWATLLDDVLKTAQSVRIDDSIFVSDFVRETEAYFSKIKDLVSNSQIVLRTDTKSHTTRATARMPIWGGFSQLVLPLDIKQVQTIQLVAPIKKSALTPNNSSNGSKFRLDHSYTGLVVDARNIGALPALVPIIYDENGNEVYGPAFVSREFAVQYGLAGYTYSFETALNHIRVNGNPLIVKGLRLHASGPCNIVISNMDASRIRSTCEHLSFFRECHVMIVLDK